MQERSRPDIPLDDYLCVDFLTVVVLDFAATSTIELNYNNS
jgi:hypothetical protein